MQYKIFRQLLTLIALACAATAAAQYTVAITEYVNDTNNPATAGEWVELYNYGTSSVTITGFKLKDDDSSGVALPPATIAPKDFLILAREKANFERIWLRNVANPNVIEWPSGFAMADSGPDEIVLTTGAGNVVWRLAYTDASNSGSSCYYAMTTFTTPNCGTKANPINRNGNDSLTSAIGYEGNEFAPDPLAYSGGGDVGSPLRGNYPGANNPAPQPTTWSVDVSGNGTPLQAGVRGLAIADQALTRHDNSDKTGILPSLRTAQGSSLRGVSGGLNAEIYDWKTRNDQPRPTTLQFLQWARDNNSELYITANIRGLTVPDATSPTTHRMYYTTDINVLTTLARDWVRYCNHIVQTYKQGDTITDSRDAAILAELKWNSSYVNEFGTADDYTTLPLPSELPIPPVKYWEIGNEPLVSLENAYSVTNAFTFSGTAGNMAHADYVNRYTAMTTAMVQEDPTIKVGPCLVNGRPGGNADILTALLQSSARIDFISYHPYGSMGDYPTQPQYEEAYLSGVYTEQKNFLDDIKQLVATYRPAQAATMEYVASETNVSDFRTNNQFQEGTMAHALGCVESVMSWARLGLRAAHYWIWITAGTTILYPDVETDWTRYPATMAFEKMRDKLGDRLLGAFDSNDKLRAYAVRNSTTGEIQLWLMNFSHTDAITMGLNLSGAPSADRAKVMKTTLQAINGTTNLFSANLPPEQNFWVPRRDVDWTTPARVWNVNPANFSITLPAATLTLLTIEDEPPAGVADFMYYY